MAFSFPIPYSFYKNLNIFADSEMGRRMTNPDIKKPYLNGYTIPINDPVDFEPKKYPQIYAAFAANFGAFALGTVLSWTATALPDLRESGQIGPMTQWEESWIGSIMTLGAVFSCPFAGYLIEKIGRKWTMLILTLPLVLGWLIISVAYNCQMMLAGRFLTGFSAGAYSIATPIYIAETADRHIRGALGSGFDMMVTLGILYIFLIGTYFNWRVQAISCEIIPLFTCILIIYAPESPRYLISKDENEEASKALCWLRGATKLEQVEEEMNELIKSNEDRKSRKEDLKSRFTSPIIRPIVIGLALMFFQQASAMDGIMFYTVDIFESAGSEINENLSTNIIGIVQAIATIAATLIVDHTGRRILLLLSSIFMTLSLAALGIFFYIKNYYYKLSLDLWWLPLTCLIIYVIAYSIGYGPIPWVMMGELLPPSVKGTGSCIITVSRWIFGFIVTLVFQDMMEFFGEDGGYWFFATLCLFGIFFTYLYVPETKGKTLEQIQQYFYYDPLTARRFSTRAQTYEMII